MNKQDFITRLTLSRPAAFELYDYDALPTTFLATDKIPIQCKLHGLFYQKIHTHLYGANCPKCACEQVAKSHLIGTDVFITRSKSKFNDKFDYTKTKYIGKDIDLIVTCPDHGDISINPTVHLRSPYGCSKCTYTRYSDVKQKEFIDQAKLVHGNKYDYSRVKYINALTKVEIFCSIHGSFWQDLYSHVKRNYGCPKCTLVNSSLSRNDFIARSKIIHMDRYDYTNVVYETMTSKVNIACKKHGNFTQRAGSHLAGYGCKKCFREKWKHTTKQFIKKAKLVHGNKYDYSRVKYNGNKNPVEILCSIHGSFWQSPNGHLSQKHGCKLCYESKGEILIERILKKYNINYIREYKISPYLYRYDFYLPELNIFIEFNGIQHYKPVDYFGGNEGFNKVKENDLIKKQIVKANSGHLIVITYLNLNENSVEKCLIYNLKRIYKYWFVVNGKLYTFKEILSLYETFKLSKDISINDIVHVLEKTIKDFIVLF